jgi:uncharacterized membrane protein YvbJ
MVTCNECGAQNPKNAKFCKECGKELKRTPLAKKPVRKGTPKPKKTKKAEKTKVSKNMNPELILQIILVLAIIILAGLIYTFSYRPAG